jgi:DNA-directed RNA polymerase subunit RPC12/RpoP
LCATVNIDEPVKSKNPDGFEKSAKLRRANLSGVRRTYLRRSDFEMQRNAEIGLFAEPSILKETIMPSPPSDLQAKNDELRCPECRALLKKRKTRQPDACEMVCGGCGQTFDVCDLETVEKLKK